MLEIARSVFAFLPFKWFAHDVRKYSAPGGSGSFTWHGRLDSFNRILMKVARNEANDLSTLVYASPILFQMLRRN